MAIRRMHASYNEVLGKEKIGITETFIVVFIYSDILDFLITKNTNIKLSNIYFSNFVYA